MAKVIKEVPKLTLLDEKLNESLQIAKDSYSEKATNELYSIITDIQLTIIELKKIK
jgi:uncharacterized membrane-anchored protein YitT (DUF2179 family)